MVVVHHERVLSLIRRCSADPTAGSYLWNANAIRGALTQLEQNLGTDEAYLVIRRNRALAASRAETQGYLSGGEDALAPTDRVTIFMYRVNAARDKTAAWWPQLRFPTGTYAFSFALG